MTAKFQLSGTYQYQWRSIEIQIFTFECWTL